MNTYLRKHIWGVPQLTPRLQTGLLITAFSFAVFARIIAGTSYYWGQYLAIMWATAAFGTVFTSLPFGFSSFDERHQQFLAPMPLGRKASWLANAGHSFVFLMGLNLVLLSPFTIFPPAESHGMELEGVAPVALGLSILGFGTGAFARFALKRLKLSVLTLFAIASGIISIIAFIAGPMALSPPMLEIALVYTLSGALLLAGSFVMNALLPRQWSVLQHVAFGFVPVLLAVSLLAGSVLGIATHRWKAFNPAAAESTSFERVGPGRFVAMLYNERSGHHSFAVDVNNSTCRYLGRRVGVLDYAKDGEMLLLSRRYDDDQLLPSQRATIESIALGSTLELPETDFEMDVYRQLSSGLLSRDGRFAVMSAYTEDGHKLIVYDRGRRTHVIDAPNFTPATDATLSDDPPELRLIFYEGGQSTLRRINLETGSNSESTFDGYLAAISDDQNTAVIVKIESEGVWSAWLHTFDMGNRREIIPTHTEVRPGMVLSPTGSPYDRSLQPVIGVDRGFENVYWIRRAAERVQLVEVSLKSGAIRELAETEAEVGALALIGPSQDGGMFYRRAGQQYWVAADHEPMAIRIQDLPSTTYSPYRFLGGHLRLSEEAIAPIAFGGGRFSETTDIVVGERGLRVVDRDDGHELGWLCEEAFQEASE